jgi:hypothetical protein
MSYCLTKNRLDAFNFQNFGQTFALFTFLQEIIPLYIQSSTQSSISAQRVSAASLTAQTIAR